MKSIIAYIQKDEWSPYIAGVLLGLIGILVATAATAFRDPAIALGASGAFESIFGGLTRLVAPDWVAKNVYFRAVRLPGVTWEVVMLLGVFIGGAFGAISSGTWKLRWMPEKQWAEAFGKSRVTRWVLVFIGAILLEYGAGVAGGCTSGLAIWGGLQLAPAAFVFMGGMFATGILTALIVYRRRY
jgi:hypothetical protein